MLHNLKYNERSEKMVKITGYWWFGGSNIKFNFNRFYAESYEDIKKIFKRKEGGVIKLNDKIELKKEAGSWNFFIKTRKNKYKRLKALNLKKIFKRLSNGI